MTPAEASALHQRAFAADRGWSEAEIAALLAGPTVQMLARRGGFALVRTVARETELLTLAVDPPRQRQGIGRALLRDWLAGAAADIAFLEVAADNDLARQLYAQAGFAEVARRAAYYSRRPAPAVDAIVMRQELTGGQGPQTTLSAAKTG